MLAVEYWSADCFYTQFVSFYFQNKHTMYLTPRKLNFRIEVTIYLHKNLRKARLERKQTSKQTKHQRTKQRWYPFLPMIFCKQFTCFFLKNLLSKHEPSTVWNDAIYCVPFLCQSNCFLWGSLGNSQGKSILKENFNAFGEYVNMDICMVGTSN